jgi:hypothetical protein
MLPLFLFLSFSESALIIPNIKRKYTIRDNLISVSATVEYRNDGPSPTTTVLYSLTQRESKHVGLVTSSLQQSSARDFGASLPTSVDGAVVTVTLLAPLQVGSTINLFISYTLGNYLLFVKPTIQLNQKISAFFNTSAFYSGAYEVLSSSITVDGFVAGSVTRYSSHSGLLAQKNSLYLSLSSPTSDDFEMEFATNRPLPYIATIRSRTFVSHWGKSKQQAFYEVRNAGPKFVGEFNRIDFTTRTPCYLDSVPLTPPRGAYSFWARDEGGQLQRDIPRRGNEIDIPLRGPMLSSWKATFTAGWTVQTGAFVSGAYRFQADLVWPTFPAPIGEVIADFLLPEGAKIGKIEIPIAANVSQYTEVANLDLNGRVVVHVETGRMASTDRVMVGIDYELSGSANFLKILLLGGAFCVLFIAIIVGRRIDLGINVVPVEGTKIKRD